MNWIYEPRGKYPDYNDDEGGYSSQMKWHEVILTILALPIFVLLAGIIELLIALSGLYFIVKETYKKGESPFPTLTSMGIILAGILIVVHYGFNFSFSSNSLLPLVSILFIAYFTIAPLTGLFLHFLHLLLCPETQGENHA